MIRIVAAAALMQASALRRHVGFWMVLITMPLQTITYLAIVQHAGRSDLTSYAVLAPAVIAVWQTALFVSGEIVAMERAGGTLEALVSTPAPLYLVLAGRIATVTGVSLLSVAESWGVAQVLFGVRVPVPHMLLFVAALLITAYAMTGTATLMSSVFVFSRSARALQNSLSYPFILLGGVLMPTSYLPGWLQPVSKLFFLSWSTDLLRDTLAAAPVTGPGLRIGAVLGLGTAAFLAAAVVLGWILARLRRAGSLGQV